MEDRLKELEEEVSEYKYWAKCRGQSQNVANYRKIAKTIRNIREEMERSDGK